MSHRARMWTPGICAAESARFRPCEPKPIRASPTGFGAAAVCVIASAALNKNPVPVAAIVLRKSRRGIVIVFPVPSKFSEIGGNVRMFLAVDSDFGVGHHHERRREGRSEEHTSELQSHH